jgi:hypothetical protein
MVWDEGPAPANRFEGDRVHRQLPQCTMSAPSTQEPGWSALGWSAYWGTADYDARVPGSPEPQLLTHFGSRECSATTTAHVEFFAEYNGEVLVAKFEAQSYVPFGLFPLCRCSSRNRYAASRISCVKT